MSSKRVLITGGAGFIGSHTADELLAQGYRVRVLDNLSPQVHGENRERPLYLNEDVELVVGDVRDLAAVRRALHGVDAVYHFASIVGVGQSMYQIEHYTSVNNLGTAVLLEALIENPVEQLVVASSVSIYGEGLYRDEDGSLYPQVRRTERQLRESEWELATTEGKRLYPIPTPETKPPVFNSVYALSKYDQECMCLMIGQAYNIPTVALRFFNAYGTRQALSNPYTGVLAIFASRILNDNPPLIFEDGCQMRDFVHVRDVARACRLAIEVPQAAYNVFNVASGNQYSISFLAERMADVLGKSHLRPQIMEKYRVGDIRHCFADISRAQAILKYQPRVSLEDGMIELAEWLTGQVAQDRSAEATHELIKRGLAIG